MKNIFTIIAVFGLGLTACQTPDYKPMDFTGDHKSFEEMDPEGYKIHLQNVREFKTTDHLVSIAGVDAVSTTPRLQPEHLTNLPDSVDYVMIKDVRDIAPEIVSEIQEIEEEKGTRTLGLIDLNEIVAAWNDMQDAKEDAGEEPGTDMEKEQFIKAETKSRLDIIDEDNMHGVVFSALGVKSKGFWTLIDNWKRSNEDKVILFRGIPSLVPENLILKCKYIIILAESNSSIGTLNGAIGRLVRFSPVKDNILVEVMVPSMDAPKQVGATPQVAAKFVLDKQDNKKYKPLGIVLNNADKDYYHKGLIYGNLRKAISMLNIIEEEK